MLEVLYHPAKFGGARISPAAGVAKNVEFFLSACLYVLFVRHAFERQSLCARFRHEGVGGTETIMMPLDRGRFVVVHPCPTFSDCCQLATPLTGDTTKCRSPKTAKIGVFHHQRSTDKPIETNFSTWVCHSTPNLALIGKNGFGTGAPKCQNLPKIVFFATGS